MSSKKSLSKKAGTAKRLERLARTTRREAADDWPGNLDIPSAPANLASPDASFQGVPVSTILATVAILSTLTVRDRRRIEGNAPLALVVSVPSADWLNPVEDALSRIRKWTMFKRSGESRSTDRPENGNGTACDALSEGDSVLGVSTSPERYLPSALMAAADIRLTLRTPSPRVLRGVIRTITGRNPPRLRVGLACGLSVTEIASCIRRGSTATACVRRLEAATVFKGVDADPALADVPLLRDSVGYEGPALEWAKGLVAAIEEHRAGTRPWSAIEDRNIVLSGDPGVGKTVFARMVAKSAGIPLIATSVSSWFSTTNGYLNDVVRAIDTVVNQAIAVSPAVLLLDECDAIPNRATVDNRYRDFWNTICSHLLLVLDSAVSGGSSKLIVIGATNFPEQLDEALVRPGRLNRVVHIPRPSVPALAGILRHHLKSDLAGEDLMPLSAIAQGATGAEAAGWARGARMTARAASREMVLADLLGQIAPPETRSPAELLAVARHESSHAVQTELLHVGAVQNVSLVARGAYAGRTSAKLRDASSLNADELDSLIVSVLAGRAADEHWGGVRSGSAGGPGSDLAWATTLAAGKHACWGLGGSLLYRGDQVEALALLRIDPNFRKTVEADLDRLFEVARDLVRQNARTIDRLARRLVAKRIMSGDEVRDVIGAPTSGAGEDGVLATVGGPHE